MFSFTIATLLAIPCVLSQTPKMLMYPKTGMAMLPSSKPNIPSDIYIRLLLEEGKNVTLTLSGPQGKWFALGFGQSMYLTEAVIYSTGKSGNDVAMARTYHLSDEGSDGVNLNPVQLWYTIARSESNGRVNVTITRPLFVDARNIQEFDLGETMINVIWARGKGMTLVEHEQKDRPIHLDMVAGTATIGHSPAVGGRRYMKKQKHHHTAGPSMLAWPAAGVKELPSNKPGNLSQIFLRLEFDATTGNATMILSAPVGKWFGIGFGQSMYLTEALIFSTGKNGTDKPMARTYHLSDEGSAGVQLNPHQVWETKYQAQSNGMQLVTVTRPLFVDAQNITEFDMGELLVNVIWARGKSLKLVEHEQKDRPIHLQMTAISSKKRAFRLRDRFHH